jgi:general nucleoside transport system permease protein
MESARLISQTTTLVAGVGLLACVMVYGLMSRTVFGFAARMAGGNARAVQLSGLPLGRLVLTGCFLAGAAAGLAGMVEVAAVHGRANASLVVGYG